ncbi:SprT family zinc-dependent metalloprotease [uncultured Campylobacter sp.]|uniref:M48 family metallopeptidase n=1 Tax=uncultured Campylobacter sp. TaxID=218934 RepID=UPI002602BC86|nr:SprT family zinc-dependent metalloprotease [uncultured Campylobacter sp.]
MAIKTPRVKTVCVKCGEFDVALNFKKGVKTTRLKVAKTGEISVSLPFYAAQKYALEFVQKNYDWLKSAHEKTLSNLPREDEFRLLGEVYRIKFEPNLKGVNLIRFASGSGAFDGLNLSSGGLGPHLYGAKFDASEFNQHLDEAKFKSSDERKFDGEIYAASLAALENHKKAFARRIYGHFIAKFAPAVNRKINRVVVRKMTTRWGSCNSRKGYINLSLNLIEKAPELVEYVVLHELTHLIYPHHQKSFYGFIAGLMPDFKTREQRLNKK